MRKQNGWARYAWVTSWKRNRASAAGLNQCGPTVESASQRERLVWDSLDSGSLGGKNARRARTAG